VNDLQQESQHHMGLGGQSYRGHGCRTSQGVQRQGAILVPNSCLHASKGPVRDKGGWLGVGKGQGDAGNLPPRQQRTGTEIGGDDSGPTRLSKEPRTVYTPDRLGKANSPSPHTLTHVDTPAPFHTLSFQKVPFKVNGKTPTKVIPDPFPFPVHRR